jgi:hypothetical protein
MISRCSSRNIIDKRQWGDINLLKEKLLNKNSISSKTNLKNEVEINILQDKQIQKFFTISHALQEMLNGLH